MVPQILECRQLQILQVSSLLHTGTIRETLSQSIIHQLIYGPMDLQQFWWWHVTIKKAPIILTEIGPNQKHQSKICPELC